MENLNKDQEEVECFPSWMSA